VRTRGEDKSRRFSTAVEGAGCFYLLKNALRMGDLFGQNSKLPSQTQTPSSTSTRQKRREERSERRRTKTNTKSSRCCFFVGDEQKTPTRGKKTSPTDVPSALKSCVRQFGSQEPQDLCGSASGTGLTTNPAPRVSFCTQRDLSTA
jgi:hypothetical protein